MKLIVGLGNPGERYEKTRHNIGFRIVESFCDRNGIALDAKKWNALWGQGTIGGERVVVLEPQTYMNLSGEAAGQAMRFFKMTPEDVVAVHDELDLPVGRIQLKKGGGTAGHNGLKSLSSHLGGPDYVRLRVGIERPPPGREVADYVLSHFTGSENKVMEDVVSRATDALERLVTDGLLAAMNVVNQKAQTANGPSSR